MTTIELSTEIDAPPEISFDLSRDVDLHLRSLAHTGERAVAGKVSGLLDLGDEVTWQGRHFGVQLRHRSRITAFDTATPPTDADSYSSTPTPLAPRTLPAIFTSSDPVT